MSIMIKSKASIFIATVCVTTVVITVVNYFTLQRGMSQVIAVDSRNNGIRVFAHYKYFVNPNVLVYDLRDVQGTSSPMDVTRVLLQYAEQQKDRSFTAVELQHRGSEKFLLQGDFFRKIGQEYGTQNPTYTLRTLPENLYKPDGSHAFGTWTGGLLGVLGRQMEDFTTWHRDWYINELTSGSNDKVQNAD